MNLYGFSHKPHDTRHSFITYTKEAGMNEYILKLIVAHSIQDITEKVYMHRTLEQLHDEISKITIWVRLKWFDNTPVIHKAPLKVPF